MKIVLSAALLLIASCATSDQTNDSPDLVPPAQVASGAAPDPRLAEMQTAMTELLERMDVLNDRIARMESAPATASVAESRAAEPVATQERIAAPAESTAPQPALQRPTARPQQQALIGAQIADDYRTAIMLFGRNRVADARRAFQDVFDSDPSGELADNALFWIGETWFAARDYQNAMRYYRRVTVEFSDQNKAPDAMFKTALSLERTGDVALARKTLQEVITRYPYSTPAASAKHELTRLKY